ncbi:hypothetical protein GCM10010185_36570 [Saccharothrix coeruleofusca]|uniref:Uncharacterized protein n=1 Tax=Saccharothrix coeruleofusca TaxID=33919 RepID=A0A918AR57_9PSEU|nr:hypothetical protein GCM10010185_36570 [Saccharothrix coeruleofusca]
MRRQVLPGGTERAGNYYPAWPPALVRGQVLPEGRPEAGNYYRWTRKCGSGCVNARFVVSERATRGGDTPDTPATG